MASGRLRTSCPTDEELIELGEDLVKWSTEETDKLRCRFAQWYTSRGLIRKQFDRMIDTPAFRVFYETARSALSERLVDGSVNPSIAHRLINHYLPEVREEERAMLKYKSDLAKEEKKEEYKSLSELQLAKMATDGKLKQE